MKILIYSSKFPPQIGGVEEVVKTLSLFLSQKNKVKIITSYNLNTKVSSTIFKFFRGFWICEKTSYEGIETYYSFMSMPRSLFGLMALIVRFPSSVINQRRILKKFKPDWINAHFLDDNLYYFYFVTLFSKTPILLDIHGNELHVFSKNRMYKIFFQKILLKSKKIVVHSDYMKDELLKRYKVTSFIYIIPNGVNLSKFKNLNKKDKALDYYLYVGRLDYKKGIDILIRAFVKLQGQVSKKLLIIGGASGDKKHGSVNIETLKNLAGNNTNIEFLGRVENSEVIEYFSNAYYCIFPSRNEPFGIVALESIACGTPFIASSGGFKEIAKNSKGGIIFKEGSVTALVNIIKKVDSDTKKRMVLSQNALQNVSIYKLESIYSSYQKLFYKL